MRHCIRAGRRVPIVLLLAFAPWMSANAYAQGVKIEEKVDYLGAPNNIRISNDKVELILSTDYGPRIMRFAPAGSKPEDNLFATIPDVTLKTDLGDWYIRGGHRLWHAPEAVPRSYVPDNGPVQVVRDGDTVKLIQPIEKETGIQKEIWVTLDPKGGHVTVVHKLTNKGLFPIEMACWAMSAMNKGGKAILPQEPYKSHDEDVLPARSMTVWKYTDLTDPRWMLGKSFITLQQDPNNKAAQKIGIQNRQGWCAYLRNNTLFLKRFAFNAEAAYPDAGCDNETFTNDVFLELETLGPLKTAAPGETITHTEEWWLYPKFDQGNGEAGLAAALQPILAETAPKPDQAAGAKENKLTTTASGLQYEDLVEGTGDTPQTGQTVVVNYTGTLDDGTAFDSNTDPKFGHVQPFSFAIGTGLVIKGWDEGVATMKVGGKRKLIIPAALAYGNNPPPGAPIKPGATLTFVVELLSITK